MTAMMFTQNFSHVEFEQWADVESLIKELHQIEGIESISKGRFFLSPGLAPTFQVWKLDSWSRFRFGSLFL